MTLVQRASQAKLLSVESGQQTTFTAFPEGTLLEAGKVRWASLEPTTVLAEPMERISAEFGRKCFRGCNGL